MRMKAMEEVRRINKEYPYTAEIRKWKEEGKKVIGWTCNYIPEELIAAGGALPLRLIHNFGEMQVEEANAYLSIYTCSYTRSILQMALDKKFNFLDGFVSLFICDAMRRLADVWKNYHTVPLLYVLDLPHKANTESNEFYRGEIANMKRVVEEATGKEITSADLKTAIASYNVTRRLLKRIQELRKDDDPPITGVEMQEVVNAATALPRDDYNFLLERLLKELEEKRSSDSPSKKKVRLMLSGSILNNVEFIRGIEEMGGIVVIDALCTGARYWWGAVDETKEPLEALSSYYLNKFGCARMYPAESLRYDQISLLANEYRVAGVISEVIRYCAMNINDQVRLRERLSEELNIPMLMLDMEYGTGATGQIKTRVQAFIEMIGGVD